MKNPGLVIAAVMCACMSGAASLRAMQSPAAPLSILVIEGEGAVNIIQQKTAVAPVIEVRDRNDQPVAGATVNFVVRAGRATFGGARTLTVTTNAAGRAAAAGFTPTGSGALQIGATATFQGQTAAGVTIAQTNVMTAAQAAAASSASAGGGSGSAGGSAAGGGAAGGGGGVSTTTLAIVGGAVAGGAVAAQQVLADAESGTTFTGQLNAVMPETEVAIPLESNYSCARSQNHTGTAKITFDRLEAPVQGVMEIEIRAEVSPGNCNHGPYTMDLSPASGSVTGPRENITAAIDNLNTFTSTSDVAGTGTITEKYAFTGRFESDTQISGSLRLERLVLFRGPRYSSDSRGSVTFQVTLRKQ